MVGAGRLTVKDTVNHIGAGWSGWLAAYFRGRLDEADDWYRRALAVFEDIGDRPHMAGSYAHSA